ncbi:pentapeptide repeat-containing protein [Streptomyces prasinopilosus]|uniref:pentapeptide repeat-containing protein n=1 Tax=Streptomyces prasinopilosus TaxID=67344 RepID=UPI003B8A8638
MPRGAATGATRVPLFWVARSARSPVRCEGAFFSGAFFSGAFFSGAFFSGAFLSGAFVLGFSVPGFLVFLFSGAVSAGFGAGRAGAALPPGRVSR